MTTLTPKNSFNKSEAADLYSVTRTGLNANWDILDAAIQLNKWDAAIDPTGTDDVNLHYAIGSIWYNATANFLWVCTDATASSAVWVKYYNNDALPTLTANWDAGAYEIRSATFESDVATGTAPFTIASTTVVPNLNASLLEGNAAAAFTGVAHDHVGGDGAALDPTKLTFAATNKIAGRKTAGAGAGEECSLSEMVDLLAASPERGDLLFRNATVWTYLHHGAANDALISGGNGADPSWLSRVYHMQFCFGTGANVLVVGDKAGLEVPITGTITQATVVSTDATGGAVECDIWLDHYADGVPTVLDTVDVFAIAATGTQSQETALTIAVAAGQWIVCNIKSVTSMKAITCSLKIVV
jgi:hypothetical protein